MSQHIPIVVMGVSGSGKSTVGAALAQRLQVPFADADDFHPEANIAKMTAGQPLTDDDRWPWLEALGAWLETHSEGAVMTCSALKRSYRDVLRQHVPALGFIHLHGDRALIAQRQATRPGHFMPAALLDSQFATLEPLQSDEAGFLVDVSPEIDEIVEAAVAGLAQLEEN